MINIISTVKSQRGGALLVAMVMIFMLSIMGISVMRSSTLEHRMAVNAIRTAATFQTAESASNFALNKVENLELAYEAGLNKGTVLLMADLNREELGMQAESRITYVGETLAPGYSMGEGGNLFEAIVYVATGESSMPNASTQSSIEQGARRIVPSN